MEFIVTLKPLLAVVIWIALAHGQTPLFRPGFCPSPTSSNLPPIGTDCRTHCFTDSQCPVQNDKCCNNGCGFSCMTSVSSQPGFPQAPWGQWGWPAPQGGWGGWGGFPTTTINPWWYMWGRSGANATIAARNGTTAFNLTGNTDFTTPQPSWRLNGTSATTDARNSSSS